MSPQRHEESPLPRTASNRPLRASTVSADRVASTFNSSARSGCSVRRILPLRGELTRDGHRGHRVGNPTLSLRPDAEGGREERERRQHQRQRDANHAESLVLLDVLANHLALGSSV